MVMCYVELFHALPVLDVGFLLSFNPILLNLILSRADVQMLNVARKPAFRGTGNRDIYAQLIQAEGKIVYDPLQTPISTRLCRGRNGNKWRRNNQNLRGFSTPYSS